MKVIAIFWTTNDSPALHGLSFVIFLLHLFYSNVFYLFVCQHFSEKKYYFHKKTEKGALLVFILSVQWWFLPFCFPPLELSPFFCISRFLQPSFFQKAGLSPPYGPDGMIFFLLPFLDIFIFLFYSFHCLSIPFPKGCRLEKGHIVPVLCSHSQKKKKNYVFTFTHLFIMENYNSFLYSKKKKKKKRNIRNNRLIIKRIITIIITTTITIIRIQPKTASVAFTKGANNPNIH